MADIKAISLPKGKKKKKAPKKEEAGFQIDPGEVVRPEKKEEEKSLVGPSGTYRKRPSGKYPWRKGKGTLGNRERKGKVTLENWEWQTRYPWTTGRRRRPQGK